MHSLTIKLLNDPSILPEIENAILVREEWEKKGTSAVSRNSIEAEKKAVLEFKKLYNQNPII